MRFSSLWLSLALSSPVLLPAVAAAQEPAPAPPAPPPPSFAPAAPPAAREDGARFRGGVALDGGALLIPSGGGALGAVGVTGQVGAQINDLIGIYAAPGLGVIFGGGGAGVAFNGAVLVDFTLADGLLGLGVGPDTEAILVEGGGAIGGAVLYGGRLHLALYPISFKSDQGPRRKALMIGADLRVLSASTDLSGSTATSSFVLEPNLSIGYQAF
ncbi:MAG TPA: hypothetical protein VHB21_05470 [Minicystis sp.]|nr:hypothetical protein [Minicystis sp.]